MFQLGTYANRGLGQLVLTGETYQLEQELANEVSIFLNREKKSARNDNYFLLFVSLFLSLCLSNDISNEIEDQSVYVF